MCVKFHDEEKRLEVIGGASCLYNDIQKLSFQNDYLSLIFINVDTLKAHVHLLWEIVFY